MTGFFCHNFSNDDVVSAIYFDIFKIVQFLVTHGADVTGNNIQCIETAVSDIVLEIIKLLQKYGGHVSVCDWNLMYQACKTNQIDIVKFLIENSININSNCVFAVA